MQFMECPCDQFASLVENKLKNKLNVVRLDHKIMAITNLHFNQEFLFLQVFVYIFVSSNNTVWHTEHLDHWQLYFSMNYNNLIGFLLQPSSYYLWSYYLWSESYSPVKSVASLACSQTHNISYSYMIYMRLRAG